MEVARASSAADAGGARRPARLRAPEAVLPRARPRRPSSNTTAPAMERFMRLLRGDGLGALRPAQADGGGGRRPRRGRRLHPRPHRGLPRPAARRRPDRPQRGEGRRAAALVGGAAPARVRAARRARPGRPPRPQLRRRRRARASGLADELADADGLRGRCLRPPRRSSRRRTRLLAITKVYLRADASCARCRRTSRSAIGRLARRLVLRRDARAHPRRSVAGARGKSAG